MLSHLSRFGFLALLVGTGLSAFGQDPVFLVPQSFVLSDSKAGLSVQSGTGNLAKPMVLADNPVRWFFVKTGAVQENHDNLDGLFAPDGRLEPKVPAAGGVMIGADFQPVVETVKNVDMTRILGRPVVSVGGTVQVRHYRSAIALMKTAWGGVQDQSGLQVPTAETSLTCNIHAILDPTRPTLGGDLAFEVSIQGSDAEGVKLYVHDMTKDTTTMIRTGEGTCHFTPVSAGQYQLCFQLARPLKGDPGAQYELFSGTMTFSIPSVKAVTP